MAKLPPVSRSGKKEILAMMQRREAEEKLLATFVDDSNRVMNTAGRIADENWQRPFDPLARIALLTAHEALILTDWIAQYVKELVRRQYDHDHILVHFLFNNDQPIRGKRLKEVQALLGEHGVRLLAMEEELEKHQERMAGTVGDLYNRLTFPEGKPAAREKVGRRRSNP
jgi:hypothetical protein